MKEDLSPAARELVDSHRTDGALTPADRKRIKHQVMLQVAALGATTAVATEVSAKASATAAAKAAGMSLASKVVVVALGVTAATGAVSVSLWALRAQAPSNRSPSAISVRTMTDVVAPAPEVPTVAAPATAPARTLAVSPAVVGAPASAAARTRAATPRVAVAAPASALVRRPAATPEVVATSPTSSAAVDSRHDDPVKTIDKPLEKPTPAAPLVVPPDPEPELRALREAREDLRAGRPASAYRRLDDFDRQRGGGMLAQERSALSAIALCQWQPGPEAQARAAEFLRSSPESPLAIRVRSACAQASKASP
jgi:hypothetical protein